MLLLQMLDTIKLLNYANTFGSRAILDLKLKMARLN